jgi:hypothetical protein
MSRRRIKRGQPMTPEAYAAAVDKEIQQRRAVLAERIARRVEEGETEFSAMLTEIAAISVQAAHATGIIAQHVAEHEDDNRLVRIPR